MRVDQICEVCMEKKATSLTHDKETDGWKFCCDNCWAYGYSLAFNRLHETDWLEHMKKKGWVDMEQFLPRFLWAIKFVKDKN